MARFLLAWELGDGLGHVNRLLPLARALRDAGHETIWAIKDVVGGGRRLGSDVGPIVAAPIRPQSGNTQPPLSLADILITMGFSQPDALKPMLRSWVDLLELVGPDVVLADYSPTALLAARILELPAVAIGNGFEIPPDRSPLPSLQPWQSVPGRQLEKSERAVLPSINSVMSDYRAPALDRLAQLYAGRDSLLCCFPEFDHFGAREDADYLGPVLEQPPEPPDCDSVSNRRRLFFYLSAKHPFTRPLLEYLARRGEPAIGYVRDAKQADLQNLSSLSLHISSEPLDMTEMLASANLVICHGGAGTTPAAILAGVPTLMVPLSIEQAMLAYRIGYAGLGVPVPSDKHMAAIDSLLRRSRQPDVYERVGAVAARYADFDPRHQAETMTARCLAQLES